MRFAARIVSGASGVGGTVVEVPEVFVQILYYLVQVEVLEAGAHVVAFREGPGDLVHGQEPLPHGLELLYLVRQGQPPLPAGPDLLLVPLLLLPSVHYRLPVRRQLHPTISGMFPAPSCPP